MRIAIYGRNFSENSAVYVQQLMDLLSYHQVEYVMYENFLNFLKGHAIRLNECQTFTNSVEVYRALPRFLLSIGGDGTLLDTVDLIRGGGLPVIGINLGRLGFLATINKTALKNAVDSLIEGSYTVDSRTMIRLESDPSIFQSSNFALNECTIHKRDTSPMIIVHAYLDGQFLNSYWADGLIVSTPTGSTAYSLSCGGPIIFPECNNFVVTPIGPHNLSVRPIIINDDQELTLEVEGRTSQFLVSLDSRTLVAGPETRLTLRKENFKINLLRLNTENYLSTLRNKLMWGLDSRN